MDKKPTYEGLEQRVKELEDEAFDRKRVDKALRKSEERLRTITDTALDSIFCKDINQRYTFVNPSMIQLMGCTEADLIGKVPEELFDKEDAAIVTEVDGRTLNGENISEVRSLSIAGKPYTFHTIQVPLRDSDGNITGISGIVRDITDFVQAEEALRKTDERYTALFDRSLDCVYIHDFEGNFIDANPAALKLFGYTKEEILSLNFASLLSQDQISLALQILEEIKKIGFQKDVAELKVRKKNGEQIHIEAKASLLSHKGEPYAIQGIGRDVTNRKRAEEALRESEERARQYLDIAGVAFVALDNEGNITLINKRGLELLGYRREELLGKNWFKTCLPERMTDEVLDVYHQLIRGEVEPVEYYENPVLTKDGKERIIAWHNSVLRNPGGEIVGILSSGEDIAERVLAEEALQESEEKYRSMMEAMKDPVYICSPDFRVEYMNPAMIRRTGRDATGEICFKVLHDLEEKCPWCMHEKALQGECFESEIVSPKDKRSYHVSHSSIVREDGSVSKMTVFRDTTDLRTLEAQLQQAQKMEAIGTLAGGIAHDFNNILGGIMGYAELAKMKAPEESKVFADLEQLIKSSRRAADLVKQILTISRHHKQEQRPVQVRYIVDEVLKLLKATFPTTIEIRENLAKDAGIVNADPTQMHQVIMNLCTNAGHAMQEDGGVLEVSLANVELDDISASKHLDLNASFYIRLSVSDTGHGISSEIMERIFDPYFTTKDTGEGTGLGLSVAQGIIKAHGGTITAYSEPGKGTTFNVYLPLIHEAEKEEKEESAQPLPTGTERILFIDDEQLLIEIGGQMLELLGYEVVTKRSSKEALELFRTEPDRFDLVITDMTMPDMTGDKLAQELINIRPDIPVILCTGHSRKISEEKAKGLGIRAFVMKPISTRVMAEAVREALDAGRSEV